MIRDDIVGIFIYQQTSSCCLYGSVPHRAQDYAGECSSLVAFSHVAIQESSLLIHAGEQKEIKRPELAHT